jgi:inorganic pyrophosphatase
MGDDQFWQTLDTLVAESELIIDRPRGSAHPRYPDQGYLWDYGYLKGTRSGDGDGIDVWVGSLAERRVMGIILTVDLLKRDSEAKVLLGCTQDEMEQILATHNVGTQSAILVRR